jgi:hypothetical protein
MADYNPGILLIEPLDIGPAILWWVWCPAF